MNINKSHLHRHCLALLDERIAMYQQEVEAAQAAANAEGKSSVGDKYETTRAQMQGERDRQARMLAEVQKQREALANISTQAMDSVQIGALVATSMATFYLTVSLGKIEFEGKGIQVISPVSPIGQELLNQTAGQSFTFRGKKIAIKEVN
jgi:transcription elongation GreA/GreB family factor